MPKRKTIIPGTVPVNEISLVNNRCPVCGSTDIRRNNILERQFFDVDDKGAFRISDVTFERYICKNKECGHSFQSLDPKLTQCYTKEFRNKVLDLYYSEGKTQREIAQMSQMDLQMVRKIINLSNSDWDTKREYELPEDIGLIPVTLKNGRILYVICDFFGEEVLDVLNEDTILDHNFNGIKNVFLSDIRVPDSVLKVFGDAKVIFNSETLKQSGINALSEDAVKMGIESDTLEKILANGQDQDLLEKLSRNPKLTQFVASYNDLLKRLADPKYKINTNLKYFKAFIKLLNTTEQIISEKEEDKEQFVFFMKKAGDVRKLADGKAGKGSSNQLRDQILYRNSPRQSEPNKAGSGTAMNFGNRL